MQVAQNHLKDYSRIDWIAYAYRNSGVGSIEKYRRTHTDIIEIRRQNWKYYENCCIEGGKKYWETFDFDL